MKSASYAWAYAIAVNATPATQLATRSNPDSSCTAAQLDIYKAAANRCLQLAKAATNASGDSILMDTIFHANKSTSVAIVQAAFDKIAKECAYHGGSLTVQWGSGLTSLCVGPTYAVAFSSNSTLVLCDNFFTTLPAISECRVTDRGMGLIHETSHCLIDTDDFAYGYDDSVALPKDKALRNADSYAFFAQSALLNC